MVEIVNRAPRLIEPSKRLSTKAITLLSPSRFATIQSLATEDCRVPMCEECKEEPATDVDGLCDRCGDMGHYP